MTSATFRRATELDLPAILRLQETYHIQNLSVDDRNDGFLSARFSTDQFAAMVADLGVIVACEPEETVVGFLCASRLEVDHKSPIISRMAEKFDEFNYQGKRLRLYKSFLYGPVCIDKSHRGKGLFPGLYTALKRELLGQFELGVAFVSEQNPRSLRAHVEKLGMTALGQFEVGGVNYQLLIFSIS